MQMSLETSCIYTILFSVCLKSSHSLGIAYFRSYLFKLNAGLYSYTAETMHESALKLEHSLALAFYATLRILHGMRRLIVSNI